MKPCTSINHMFMWSICDPIPRPHDQDTDWLCDAPSVFYSRRRNTSASVTVTVTVTVYENFLLTVASTGSEVKKHCLCSSIVHIQSPLSPSSLADSSSRRSESQYSGTTAILVNSLKLMRKSWKTYTVTECLTSDIFSMLLCGVSDCIYLYLV